MLLAYAILCYAICLLATAFLVQTQLVNVYCLYLYGRLAVGLSLWQGRRSGTHYRLNFVICLSVLVTLDAA